MEKYLFLYDDYVLHIFKFIRTTIFTKMNWIRFQYFNIEKEERLPYVLRFVVKTVKKIMKATTSMERAPSPFLYDNSNIIFPFNSVGFELTAKKQKKQH